jgi:hypothetical protein
MRTGNSGGVTHEQPGNRCGEAYLGKRGLVAADGLIILVLIHRRDAESAEFLKLDQRINAKNSGNVMTATFKILFLNLFSASSAVKYF